MDDADDFLRWCARRNVSLIMHGHKHLPRHVERAIECGEGQRARRITAVGFGTSLGAEGYPLTYNVLTWDERSQRCAATFYEDPGDGSGFARRYVALHVAE
jgi:hypothetical protein